MKINLIKQSGKALATLLLLCACASCNDVWDDHYSANPNLVSDKTLYQLVSADSTLSDFKEILDSVRVSRNIKPTVVRYSDWLSQDQVYTLWAPVNGTFNKQVLLDSCMTTSGMQFVEKTFIKNHLTPFLLSFGAAKDTRVRLANNKYVQVSDTAFDGIPLIEKNVAAKNGLLNKIRTTNPFRSNIYETFMLNPDFAPLASFMKASEYTELDLENSVASGVVDGKTVYIDSVTYTGNRALGYLGPVQNEDSTYWALLPTATAWNAAYTTVSNYFVYPKTLLKGDSLQRAYTNQILMYDLLFSPSQQTSMKDSLVCNNISLHYSKNAKYYKSDEVGVYYNPWQSGGILSNVADSIQCSNGKIYKLNDWPFDVRKIFFQERKIEGESTYNIKTDTLCTKNVRRVNGDSISNNGYVAIVPRGSTDNWSVTYNVSNLASATYDIKLALLPKQVYNSASTDIKPNKFSIEMTYYDKNGVLVKTALKDPATKLSTFTSSGTKFDTITIANAFKFLSASYGLTSPYVTFKITCVVSAKEGTKYSRDMYLDFISFKPVVVK
jgi:hypothetical protein